MRSQAVYAKTGSGLVGFLTSRALYLKPLNMVRFYMFFEVTFFLPCFPTLNALPHRPKVVNHSFSQVELHKILDVCGKTKLLMCLCGSSCDAASCRGFWRLYDRWSRQTAGLLCDWLQHDL